MYILHDKVKSKTKKLASWSFGGIHRKKKTFLLGEDIPKNSEKKNDHVKCIFR